jgi:hypothetical protein
VTQAEIDRILDWGYGGTITVESHELAEEARQYQGKLGLRTRAARYRVVFTAAFSAHAQSENAAESLRGLIRGLGGTIEEL